MFITLSSSSFTDIGRVAFLSLSGLRAHSVFEPALLKLPVSLERDFRGTGSLGLNMRSAGLVLQRRGIPQGGTVRAPLEERDPKAAKAKRQPVAPALRIVAKSCAKEGWRTLLRTAISRVAPSVL